MRLSSQTRIVLYAIALVLAISAFITVGLVTARKRSYWWGELKRWQNENVHSVEEARSRHSAKLQSRRKSGSESG